MKISISCPGTFWAFRAGEQFQRMGILHRLIVTHPPFRGEQISREHLVYNLFPEMFVHGPKRLHLPWRWDYVKSQSFDWWARRHIGGSDLLVAYSACSLHTVRAAKEQGIVTVLERGSAHILEQWALLDEEYRRFGLTFPPMDQRMVTKQLWEYGEADYISACSTFVRDSFLARGFPPERVITAPLGYEAGLCFPGKKTDSTFRILVGGIGLRKGTPYILEAIRDLNRANVDVVLLGGMGPDVRAVLAQHAGRYRWPGYVSEARLADLMRQGSVFVQASVEDGFGLMILQAMASGLPVICTTNTGGPDVIREGEEGFIVPIRDAVALRDRLQYLYDHPEAQQRMAEAAVERAKLFTWEAYAARMAQEYRRILDAPKKALSATSDLSGYNDYLWYVSDLWGANSSWDERMFRRHFDGALCPGDVALDIGCGDARAYQKTVMATAGVLHGIDVSKDAVAGACRKGVLARVHDISSGSLPYADEMFDVISCFEVLEHLFDPKFAVHEMYRVLRPGGRLVVSVPNAGYFRERLVTLAWGDVPVGVTDYSNPWMAPHIRFFSRGSLERLLKANGFIIERVRSKADPSLLDGLDMFGGVGRFLGRQLKRWIPPVLQGSFLGDLWPALFAPGLIVLARRPERDG